MITILVLTGIVFVAAVVAASVAAGDGVVAFRNVQKDVAIQQHCGKFESKSHHPARMALFFFHSGDVFLENLQNLACYVRVL